MALFLECYEHAFDLLNLVVMEKYFAKYLPIFQLNTINSEIVIMNERFSL